MPEFIVRFDRAEARRYIRWSTICDAPTSNRMTREEMIDHLITQRGHRLEEAEERVARADRPCGSSCLDGCQRDDLFACNRAIWDAAPEETDWATEDELWEMTDPEVRR